MTGTYHVTPIGHPPTTPPLQIQTVPSSNVVLVALTCQFTIFILLGAATHGSPDRPGAVLSVAGQLGAGKYELLLFLGTSRVCSCGLRVSAGVMTL
jgi:hypothetical protein